MVRMTVGIVVMLAMGTAAPAADQAAVKKLYETATPSLVAVQYTYDGDLGRREFVGPGIIVSEEGLVLVPMGFVPLQFSDQHLKDFKVIVPGDDEKEVDAVFVGRDERADLAFVRAKEKQKWAAVKFTEAVVEVGQTVRSVGLLPKEAGYRAYVTEAFVSAILRGPVPQVLVSADGLSAVGFPVFDAEGKAIGLVLNQPGQNLLLNSENRNALAALANPPRLYVPARDFLPSLADLPTEGQELKIPWLGAPLTGLKKEVAEHFNLKGQPVVLVGDIIADSPAAKAGLKAGDKILKMNGKALERGDEPAETPQILMRKVRWMKVGDKVTFSVLREMDQPPVEVAVTLEEQPRQAHQANRYFAEDLGFTARELVFADTYSKKLPADQPGVIVAFVRQNSSAASAKLAPSDLITKMNGTAIRDLEQFKKLYQELRKDPEKAKDSLVLEVLRDRNTQVIRIEPPQ